VVGRWLGVCGAAWFWGRSLAPIGFIELETSRPNCTPALMDGKSVPSCILKAAARSAHALLRIHQFDDRGAPTCCRDPETKLHCLAVIHISASPSKRLELHTGASRLRQPRGGASTCNLNHGRGSDDKRDHS
jgi:hypothetical protein